MIIANAVPRYPNSCVEIVCVMRRLFIARICAYIVTIGETIIGMITAAAVTNTIGL